MTGFFQFAILGLGLSAVYSLLGVGIVLIYRGSGVVNFAHGTFALAGAIMFTELRARGVSLGVTLALTLAAGLLIGVLMQNLVMRRLRDAAPITRIIATLGVFIAAQAGAGLHYAAQTIIVPQFLPQHLWHLAGIPIQSDRVILFGIAVAVTAALAIGQKRLRVGLATRAAAENATAAAALAWSPNALATISWGLGGLLAAGAGALIVPLTGLFVTTLSLLIVPALAAVLVGGFDSVVGTLLGATAIGVGQSLVERYWSQTGAPDALPFVIIIVVLVLTGRALPLREHLTQRFPSVGSGRVRVVPFVVLSVVMVLLMTLVFNVTWQSAFTVQFEEAILLLSVVVLTGYAGQISLMQVALAGLGAFVAGRLVASQGWPFWAAFIAGVLAAVPIGAVFAVPALRTRGINLAIVTLGLGVTVNAVLFQNVIYTGGLEGTRVGSAKLFGFDIDAINHPARYGVFVLVLLLGAGLLVANLRRSPLGRRLLAIRENERAAASLGISVVGAKLYAFAIAAVLASVAGLAIGFQSTSIVYTNFTPFASILTVVYTVIGGLGYIAGPLLGASFSSGATGSLFNGLLSGINGYLGLIGGVAVVLVLIGNPDGLVSGHLGQARFIAKRWRASALRGRVPEWLRGAGVRRARRGTDGGGARSRNPARLLSTGQRMEVPRRALELEGLTVRFGGVTAVNNVSLTVAPGTIVGLIGPNGAGKTTLIDAVTGFVRPAAGSIRVGNQTITGLPAHRRVGAGVARSWQSLELLEDVNVLENLQVAAEFVSMRWWHGVRSLVLPHRAALNPAASAAIVEFGLLDDLEQVPGGLPYGRRRLVGIARAVALNPSVLLLDEPTAGLSDAEAREVGVLIQQLAASWGMAILLVEHNVNLVMSISERVIVLDFGQKIAEGPPAEVRRNPAVIEAYLGAPPADAGVAGVPG